jgi:hypothetical protein
MKDSPITLVRGDEPAVAHSRPCGVPGSPGPVKEDGTVEDGRGVRGVPRRGEIGRFVRGT